jgi:hypothetical protein
MVQFQIHVNSPGRMAYIPKVLVKCLGSDLILMPGIGAALLFSEGEDIDSVLKSVQVILSELALEKEKRH